ncbi:MAG: BCCT family transporter [Lachnospiraceae bacterium]|nr:BCCT family transporter [Lachnospiraceae bacterium]MDD3615418.1 BCCT family transporter [Lachnospiraceae bacterium]
MKEKVTLRKPVFITMCIVYIGIIILGLVSPEAFAAVEDTIVTFACSNFGWAYELLTLALVGFCVWVIFSKKIGSIKLGGKDAKPIMGKWSWFVISLCGGIATGIVFWGIAEPVTHFMSGIPGFADIGTENSSAALLALSTCYLHWGVSEYAYYCVAGIVIGVAVYNLKLPYRISSCLYPLIGKRAMGAVGTVIDILCVFGLAGGVSASLCEGALQIGAGIGILQNVTPGKVMWIIILIAVVITFILSSYTGISKGVRFFSDKNAKLFIVLLAFVLFTGPTSYILNLATEAFGFHVTNFFRQSLYLGAFDKDQWPTWWTVNYWSWMIAYAPLMGIFLAKVARGRTLKEFVLYNFLYPGIFGVLWFGVFGGASINFQIKNGVIWNTMQTKGTESAVYAFFDNLPFSQILCVVFLFTVFISIVTLADSMTTTISSLSINVKNAATVEPPAKVKIFWGLTLSLVAFVNLATANSVGAVSGIDATKQLAILAAFPLLIVMILIVVSGVKMLSHYEQYDTVDHPEASIVDPAFIADYDGDDAVIDTLLT